MDKSTLLKYQQNRKEIMQLAEEIQELWGVLSAPGTQRMTGMPSAHTGISDPTGNGAAAIKDLCDLYQKRILELCAAQIEIENALKQLDGELRTIIRYRYIRGYKWETICNKLGSEEYGPMDWTTVHRKHRKALRKLAEVA
jgi:DNA-directed RNA polymerase specialized sigma24 family protein